MEHSLAPEEVAARQPEPEPEFQPEPHPEPELPLPTYDDFLQEQDDALPAYNDIFSPRGAFCYFQHSRLSRFSTPVSLSSRLFMSLVFNTRALSLVFNTRALAPRFSRYPYR